MLISIGNYTMLRNYKTFKVLYVQRSTMKIRTDQDVYQSSLNADMKDNTWYFYSFGFFFSFDHSIQ